MSSSVTIGTPRRKATSEISHWASFSKPSPSTTIEGSPPPSGATARRIAAKRSIGSPARGRPLGQRAVEQVVHRLPGQRGEAEPGRHAHVVLEDVELAVGAAHDVEPGEAGPDRDIDALHVGLVERPLLDQAGGHDARLDDPPLPVGVAQERVERAHPLVEAAVEPVPLLCGEHPRHGVDHELVRPGGAVADLALERAGAQLLAERGEVVRLERLERGAVMRPRLAARLVGLVVVGRCAHPPEATHGYAVAASRPSSSTAASRILNFWILPVTVIGNSSTKAT